MYQWLCGILVCPSCSADLNVEVLSESKGRIEDGVLLCSGCDSSYLVIDGIPRFVSYDVLKSAPGYIAYLQEYGDKLAKFGVDKNSQHLEAAGNIERLETQTNDHFGYEWDVWKRWGWLTPDEVDDDLSHSKYDSGRLTDSKADFGVKSRLSPEELAQAEYVLDAGCGNGRFVHQAAQVDGDHRIIGIDLGTGAAEAAHDNCHCNEQVQIIQGNLFSLPFPPEIFEIIYTIGVLQHTGDPERAFASLASHLAPDGSITVHVYHRNNPLFQINDYALRSMTTRLPDSWVMRFSRLMASLTLATERIHPIGPILLNQIIRAKPTVHQMFDWYNAPITDYFTYGEILSWFEDNGLYIEKTRMQDSYGKRMFYRPGTANVKGRNPDT